MSDYIEGHARAWSFRWSGCGDPRQYIVTVEVPGFCVKNFAAVVDDFGNLVKVAA